MKHTENLSKREHKAICSGKILTGIRTEYVVQDGRGKYKFNKSNGKFRPVTRHEGPDGD